VCKRFIEFNFLSARSSSPRAVRVLRIFNPPASPTAFLTEPVATYTVDRNKTGTVVSLNARTIDSNPPIGTIAFLEERRMAAGKPIYTQQGVIQ